MAHKPAEKPLWAQLRDTHGEDIPSTEPLSVLLGAHPNLRGLNVPELARAIEVTPERAERAIDSYVRDAVPAHLVPSALAAGGQSVDVRLAMAGRAAPPGWVTSDRGRSRVDERERRADAGAWNDSPYASAPLPLGFFYRMPNRSVYDFVNQTPGPGGTYPTLVRVDPPTAFDAQMATILRAPIEKDPDDPSMPHPNMVRAFVFAMAPGGSGMVTNANGVLAAHPGGLNEDGSDPWTILAPYAQGAREDDPQWPRPLAGEGWDRAAIQRAFAAFNWYGPLPGDLETPDGVIYCDAWSKGEVKRERYVYWYQIDDDGNWNRCQQVQGWTDEDGGKWILPSKWGEKLRAWMWRPTDGQRSWDVGEWRTFFAFDRWVQENGNTLATIAFWIAAAAITLATFGAGSGALVVAASVQAVLLAAQRLYVALMADDPSKAMVAVVELGKAFNGAAGEGGLPEAIKKNNPGLAKFAESVAAPFQKIYDAAKTGISDIYALWDKAQAMKGQLPIMGQVAWTAAIGAFGGTKGPGAWLQMARLPTTSEVGAELLANAPPWARDLISLGLTLSALEQAQQGSGAKSLVFYQAPVSVQQQGQGFFQIPKFTQEAVKAIWTPPPPPIVPTVPKFVASPGSGPKGAASAGGAGVVLVGAAAAAWYFFMR